jgi:hypothetical protein
MKRWTTNRFAWIDRQFIAHPASHPGSTIPDGATVGLSPRRDPLLHARRFRPRLAGGNLPRRPPYQDPPVSTPTPVFRPLRSAQLERRPHPTFVVRPVTLAITEIMFHPGPLPAPPARRKTSNTSNSEHRPRRPAPGGRRNGRRRGSSSPPMPAY